MRSLGAEVRLPSSLILLALAFGFALLASRARAFELKPEVSSVDSNGLTKPTKSAEAIGSGSSSDEKSQETYTTTESETETESEDDSSAGSDAHDAPDCSGLSVGQTAEGKKLTDNERFLNLQTCIQRKMQARLKETRRNSLEAFEKLSLSGGCSSSLMSLQSGLADTKSYAFKFMDASAKIPSGVMYGLLSDFGDFDECVSIRSNPAVDYEHEQEEGAFSGKYCLVSLRLNYRVDLEPNTTILDGIIPDGLLWDDMIRNYWISKTPKPIQVGVCVPSRCNMDDLRQLAHLVGENYNTITEIQGCQDGDNLRRQYQADLLQRIIMVVFATLIALTILGTVIDRYHLDLADSHETPTGLTGDSSKDRLLLELLTCFAITRNWPVFIRKNPNARESSRRSNWTCLPSSTILVAPSISNDNLNMNPSSSNTDSMRSETPTSLKTTFHIGDPSDKNRSMARQFTTDSTLSQLTIKIQPDDQFWVPRQRVSLSHLSGLRMFVIIWITMGQSFLYPSANNYQYYRSIINMNITKNSLWFTTTNYTLGLDMLLYMAGLVFVYKLAQLKLPNVASNSGHKIELNSVGVLSLIAKKILRFWPTYLSLIAIAIVAPLISDGPMWPEMVGKRLGLACRQNWWSNLLFVNNFLSESEICLPSSWFVSVLMQLLVVGSLIIVLVNRSSIRVALVAIFVLLSISCGYSFAIAYLSKLPAPVIRMDESFVIEIDENIFRLYTSIFNNLGPFLVGMLGGLVLVKSSLSSRDQCPSCNESRRNSEVNSSKDRNWWKMVRIYIRAPPIWPLVLAITVLVLTSVLHQSYSRLCSAFYWSLHRVLWAICTGYLIHQCAIYKWRLLHDFLSLSSFIPISRLIFIAYLVFPMLTHVHTGLVRDGLHVTAYNMTNIYLTRFVTAFIAALFIHLLVELPFCSVEEILLNRWLRRVGQSRISSKEIKTFHPLLAVAPIVAIPPAELRLVETKMTDRSEAEPSI